MREYVRRSKYSRRPKLKKKKLRLKFESPVYADTSLDYLLDHTAGTPVCPKCDSSWIFGHVKEFNGSLATVDWFCEDCGHKWVKSCPYEDGVLVLDDDEALVNAQSKFHVFTESERIFLSKYVCLGCGWLIYCDEHKKFECALGLALSENACPSRC